MIVITSTKFEDAASIPLGLSCFIPYKYMAPINCYVLKSTLPDGFAAVYTHDMNIRILKGSKILEKQTAAHFNVFCSESSLSLTPEDATRLIQQGKFWNVCTLKACGEDQPWSSDDDSGLFDYEVCQLYRLAKYFYPNASSSDQLHLNNIMTVIAEEKPTLKDLLINVPMAHRWYYTLIRQEQPPSGSLLVALGSLLFTFEDALNIAPFHQGIYISSCNGISII